jgi:hypothetical protein
MEWLSIIPIIVVLVLLFRQQNMLVAGFVGGLLALIIAAIFGESLPMVTEEVDGKTVDVTLNLERAYDQFLSTIPEMLSFTSPIVNSAAAAMVAGVGGYAATLELARRALRGRVEYLAAFIVLLQALAAYAAGLGAGNTVITAPLIAAAVGATPGVIAGMAIATAGAFTTSPSSAESALTSQLAGLEDVTPYVDTMRPIFILAVISGMVIAWIDVKRRGGVFVRSEEETGVEINEASRTYELDPQTSARHLWKLSIPALFLLGAVILASPINSLLTNAGLAPIVSPLFYISITIGLVALLAGQSLNDAAQAFVDGAGFILLRLLAVGVFLAFINMIGDIGAFEFLGSTVLAAAPGSLVVTAAALLGFLIAIPAGAYSVAVMGLVGPALASAGFGPLQLGFVMVAIGLGTQISYVQLNVAALSYGFDVSIPRIVRTNAPFVIPAAVVILALSWLFAGG